MIRNQVVRELKAAIKDGVKFQEKVIIEFSEESIKKAHDTIKQACKDQGIKLRIERGTWNLKEGY